MASKTSETITENIFRNFYGSKTYIEKSAIPKEYGFVSKKNLGKMDIQTFLKTNRIIVLWSKLRLKSIKRLKKRFSFIY